MIWSLLLACSFAKYSNAWDYSDNFARYKMYPMAAGVWNENPQKCIQSGFPDGKLKRRIVTLCDKNDTRRLDTCCAFTAYSLNEKAIILSFRGTSSIAELIVESEVTIYDKKSPWPAGGNVSKYFHDAFFNLWNAGVKDDVLSLVSQYPGFNIYVTGHSLGGALSALGASYIAYMNIAPPANVHLLNFGEPRVGDHNFAKSVDRDLPYAYRVTHNKDIVPHLPLRDMEHYIHHKSEVNYKEDMGPGQPFTVCSDQDESMNCSDGNIVDLSAADHVKYFNVDIVGTFTEHHCNFTSAGL